MLAGTGRIACPTGKSKRLRSIAVRSRASGGRCPAFSHPACSAARLPGRSFRRRPALQSTPTGALIRCAPIVWREPWRREAASRMAGRGSLAKFGAEGRQHCVPDRALSRKGLCARPRFLLRVRAARLSIRVASRPVEQRPEQAGHLAWRVRHCLAIPERAKRTSRFVTTASGTSLRPNGRPPLEERGSRSSHAALSCLERASQHALAGPA